MIILKEKVTGYNNTLTLATKEMKFGINEDVNKMKVVPKTIPQEPKHEGCESQGSISNETPIISKTAGTEDHSVLPLLGSAITIGFLIAKYVI